MIPAIHTLTANLLWEQTFVFPHWEAGRTQRARERSFQVGGKGANVSRMLHRLGAPTEAVLFPGGATGAECLAWLQARGVPCRPFSMDAPTRTGLVLHVPGQPETTFLGPDVALEAPAVRACVAHLDACPAGDVLALCGSVPGWNEPACEPLRDAIRRWIARGPVVADSYGPPLAWLVEQPLAWVKINRTEFDGLFPAAERSRPLPERLAAARNRWPVEAWVVTDGPRPVWQVTRREAPASLEPPAVTEVSPTGSGDILHAVLLHAVFHHGLSVPAALRLALPYAAANAAQPTVGDFPLNNLPSIRSIG